MTATMHSTRQFLHEKDTLFKIKWLYDTDIYFFNLKFNISLVLSIKCIKLLRAPNVLINIILLHVNKILQYLSK